MMRANLTYESGCLFTQDPSRGARGWKGKFARLMRIVARPGRLTTRRGGRGEEPS